MSTKRGRLGLPDTVDPGEVHSLLKEIKEDPPRLPMDPGIIEVEGDE